jgi:hypothetical protein
VTVALVLFPALTFVPPLRPLRMALRMGHYGVGMIGWLGVLSSGRARRSPSFPGRSWAVFSAGWLALELFNPTGELPLAAPMHLGMALSILAPIFWAPRVCGSRERLDQMLGIMFWCNFASLSLGFLQFGNPGVVQGKAYVPGRFDPPSMQIIEMQQGDGGWEQLMIKRPDGRKAFRPCGLTDSPGGAAVAASTCCLLGMAYVLRRGPLWKRAFYGVACLMGMNMLYLCQVRVIYLVTLGGLGLLGVCLFLRRDFRSLSLLAGLGLAIFAAGLAWAVRNGGEAVLERFAELLEHSASETFEKNRGGFLANTFETIIWDYPLGAGLGRWGMMSYYFGNFRNALYSEIQPTAWVYDGGIPLLVGYSGALALCIWHVFRLSIRARDPEFAKVASLVVGMASGVVVMGLGSMPFMAPMGIQCWLIVGATIGAGHPSGPAWAGRGAASAAPRRGRA